ncbi:MAG: TlpA family protein disulfide reductase [Planctomycetes bacterium]|nr:TlpA family protein disulfide reductase [Planctomycetota bacterium]
MKFPILALCILALGCDRKTDEAPEQLLWYARLDVAGEALPFYFELQHERALWRAFLINGEERIEVPHVEYDGDQLLLDMPHYDSRLRARREAYDLVGEWEKRRSATEVAHVPFRASCLDERGGDEGSHDPGLMPEELRVSGRWLVHFDGDDDPAVAILNENEEGTKVTGTFLTSTGDYRYLSGANGDFVTLSCFDGAHAFLFKASVLTDGTLKGDFWSGNWHHQEWTAKRDDAVELSDPFAQTRWNGTTKLADLSFPDLDGKKHALSEFAGKATLLVVFGSWCPNCNDEAQLLKELDAKYRARGLRILPLAFELTGEFARDAAQVRIFQQRHALELPFFLCGSADKDEATKTLGLVDHIRAFPTTVFVGADGLVKAVHSGFAGPATGEEHTKLVREFEERLEDLLR